MKPTHIPRSLALAGAMLGLAATSAMAVPTNYGLLTTVVPTVSAVNSQGGNFTAFDIGYVDPVTGYYYIADRSNAAVDVINGATNKIRGASRGRSLRRTERDDGAVGPRRRVRG